MQFPFGNSGCFCRLIQYARIVFKQVFVVHITVGRHADYTFKRLRIVLPGFAVTPKLSHLFQLQQHIRSLCMGLHETEYAFRQAVVTIMQQRDPSHANERMQIGSIFL